MWACSSDRYLSCAARFDKCSCVDSSRQYTPLMHCRLAAACWLLGNYTTVDYTAVPQVCCINAAATHCSTTTNAVATRTATTDRHATCTGIVMCVVGPTRLRPYSFLHRLSTVVPWMCGSCLHCRVRCGRAACTHSIRSHFAAKLSQHNLRHRLTSNCSVY